ncbi:hypothetical protein FOZG_10588 [Fusarium oxysporum Fo47]|uniref:Heterokaryon incompatibility domain-containing protein n=1 Tax=Fusarium oxysporum Fo47 TaxID=660027 RepID=W9K3R3_FUSOX|nr:hypothetical protein FOZG_10588 [Fusarium oxysporum Fo47]
MRLINTKTLELHEFFSENVPPYAILSHAWGAEEVTFQDWQNRQLAASKQGFFKIKSACYQSLNQNLEWLWVDTNCIDKTSSAELTEAINSMFAYYQKSEVCFAYLPDVSTSSQDRGLLLAQIRGSRWFTRGWTLQELIAPLHLVFYAADWSRIGRKDRSLADLITSITNIDMMYLSGQRNITRASVSKRMSWLANRTTTRTEDMAYCMLGIFDINMPLLYGEGKRAFFRLQEEIIRGSNDHTIFCWEWNDDVPDDWGSLLAPWPTVFEGSSGFEGLKMDELSVFSMTNAGLSIRLPTITTLGDAYKAASSWFIMLQAAPASTARNNPQAACIRVSGRSAGDLLYVSRFPYPPRPMAMSRTLLGNFNTKSLIVMNRLANGKTFLDDEHPAPSFVSINDPNEYTLGRIGNHNVVIAVLSQGYGTSSAASVATHMTLSFLNIRIGLLVGISGGVPGIQHDIRLGDVIASTPGNGHNGVFAYDMGVALQGQEFEIRRVLNAPPFQLLAAMNGLRAQHKIQVHRLQQSIREILGRRPKLRTKFGRPDPDSDRLYFPHIVHPSGQSSHCAGHCGSDPSTLVLRPERMDAENGIVIHYGLIASGNTLCRDANLRDKFAQKGVLCFEMEAAGLINYFPCVVIRGICDYSDPHKTKDWQGYAAMTAAAYAKDLLKHVTRSQVATKRETRACGTKCLTGHYSSLLMETVFVFMLFLLVEAIASNVV